MVPGYVVQPLLILALLTAAHVSGMKTSVVTAMAATAIAIAIISRFICSLLGLERASFKTCPGITRTTGVVRE